jgi:hypothetical protein
MHQLAESKSAPFDTARMPCPRGCLAFGVRCLGGRLMRRGARLAQRLAATCYGLLGLGRWSGVHQTN